MTAPIRLDSSRTTERHLGANARHLGEIRRLEISLWAFDPLSVLQTGGLHGELDATERT